MEKITSLKRQYQQLWQAHLDFLSFFDTIRFCWYIATLDDKTDNIIQSKHNLLANLTDEHYGSKSDIFDLNIHNFSSNTLNETMEFVLRHGLEFCILPPRIKRTYIFWIWHNVGHSFLCEWVPVRGFLCLFWHKTHTRPEEDEGRQSPRVEQKKAVNRREQSTKVGGRWQSKRGDC